LGRQERFSQGAVYREQKRSRRARPIRGGSGLRGWSWDNDWNNAEHRQYGLQQTREEVGEIYLFEAHTCTMGRCASLAGACTRHVPGRRRTPCRMTSIPRSATDVSPLACGHSTEPMCLLFWDKRVDFCQSNLCPDFWWLAPLPQQKFPVQLLVCPMASPAACGEDAVLPRCVLPPCPAKPVFVLATFGFSPTAQSGIPRAYPGSSHMTLSRPAGSTWKRLLTAGVRAPYSRASPTRSRPVSTVTSCGYSVRGPAPFFLPRPRAADAPLLPSPAGIYEEALVITKAITVPALSPRHSLLCSMRLF
jgi:hypothetical protein